MKLRIKSERGYLSTIGLYSPEEGRVQETNDFYDVFQTTVKQTNQNEFIIIAGDINASIGNNPIADIMGPHGEQTINSNGTLLIDLVGCNTLKITNTFFKRKDIYKFTLSTRGSRSIIDYTIANRKLAPLVRDTRIYREKNIGPLFTNF